MSFVAIVCLFSINWAQTDNLGMMKKCSTTVLPLLAKNIIRQKHSSLPYTRVNLVLNNHSLSWLLTTIAELKQPILLQTY